MEGVPQLIIQRFAQIPTLDFGKVLSGDTKSALIDIVNPSSEPQELRLCPLPINGKLSLKILESIDDQNQQNQITLSPKQQSIQCSLVTPDTKYAGNKFSQKISFPTRIAVDGRGRCRVEVTWSPSCQQTLREDLLLLWGRIGLHIEVKGWATQRRHTIHSDANLCQKNKLALDLQNIQKTSMSTPPPPQQRLFQADQENKILIQGLSPVQSSSPSRLPLTPVQQSTTKQPDIIDMMQIENDANREEVFITPLLQKQHQQSIEYPEQNISMKKINNDISNKNNDNDQNQGQQQDPENNYFVNKINISNKSNNINDQNQDQQQQEDDTFFSPQSDFFESVPSLKFRSEQFPVEIVSRKKSQNHLRSSSSVSGGSFGVRNKLMTSSSRLSLQTSRSFSTVRSGKSREMKSREEQKRDFSYCQKEQVWEKQESALVQWLNLKLSTPERDDNQNKFVDDRTQSKVRGVWMRIVLQDEQLRSVMTKIEQRIDEKMIVLNPGNNYLCDVYKKQGAVQAVISFNQFWIRLVLETIAKNQQTTLIQGASWQLKESEELIRIFLFNEHPNVQSAEFDFETPAFKRMLQMLLILDISYPKISEKFSGIPLLFKKSALVKSTEEVLSQVLDGSVFGAGDIVRSFGRMGYQLVQKQQEIFEFNFDITNLAVDLRDGIRLARLAEVLTGNKKILSSDVKFFPANSKTTRRWNVTRALEALNSGGIQISGRIDPDDIVEGNREKTLLLLWEIQQTCLVQRQLDVSLIHREISQLKNRLFSRGESPLSVSAFIEGLDCLNKDAVLILEWTMLLAQFFNLPSKNITLAFADGRLLCKMVQHYIPRLCEQSEVYQLHFEGIEECDDWVDFYVKFDSLRLHQQQQIRQCVRSNYDLIQQVAWQLGDVPCLLCWEDCFSPPGPDPKIVLMFLSLFAAQLLDASIEERAVTTIQKFWRKKCAIQQFRELQDEKLMLDLQLKFVFVRKSKAAKVIQRQFRIYQDSIRCCSFEELKIKQTRSYLCRKQLQSMNSAAGKIQRQFKKFIQVKQFRVVLIQSRFRMIQVYTKYQKILKSVSFIQNIWRAKKVQKQFLNFRSFVIKNQAVIRGFLVRKKLQQYQNSALKIQSFYKMHCCVKQYIQIKKSVRKIQLVYCMYKMRTQVQYACIIIQKFYRRYSCRKRYLNTKIAVRRIQQSWYGIQEFKKLNADFSAQIIQKYYKSYIWKKSYQLQRQQVIRIQSVWRGFVVRKMIINLKYAVKILEKQWKIRHEKISFQRKLQQIKRELMESSVRKLQRCWRWYLFKQQLLQDENSINQTAQCWDCNRKKFKILKFLARQFLSGKVGQQVFQFLKFGIIIQQERKQAVQIIQQGYIQYVNRKECSRRLKILGLLKRQAQVIYCRRKFLKTRRCCILIQQSWRKVLKQRRDKAAAKIQAVFRGQKVRRKMGLSKRQVHQRLVLATKEVQKNPKKQIGTRCKEALEKLLAAKSHVHIAEVCAHIKSSTAYSKICCELIAKNGGVCALLKFISSCNRSGPHVQIVSSALDILGNICRFEDLLGDVLNGENFLEILTERLQLYRDMEDVFLKIVSILGKVLQKEDHLQQAAEHATVLKQWHGIKGLLERKRDSDALYLSRLEGKKGSDVCAQQATRKLVTVKRQLEAFYPLIKSVDQKLIQLNDEFFENNIDNQKENNDGNNSNRRNSNVEQSPMTSKISNSKNWQPKNVKIQEAMRNYNKRKDVLRSEQSEQKNKRIKLNPTRKRKSMD